MKKTVFFRFALVVMTVGLMQSAHAGAAVALAPNNQLTTAYGGPVQREKARALNNARRLYGDNVRIIAATDLTGYGAIAVARHPNGFGWIIGVALGKRSATEADTLAIEGCRKAGGVNAQVKWAFQG
jgi:hypothetical protein